jgi:hypothetical protein
MRPARPPLFYLFLAAGPALVLLGLTARWMPPPFRPVCVTHRLTGYPCPGCGSFRALALFSSGKWMQAFLTQPLMTLVFTAVALAAAAALVMWLLKKPLPPLPAPRASTQKWLLAGFFAALLVNWIYLVRAGI